MNLKQLFITAPTPKLSYSERAKALDVRQTQINIERGDISKDINTELIQKENDIAIAKKAYENTTKRIQAEIALLGKVKENLGL